MFIRKYTYKFSFTALHNGSINRFAGFWLSTLLRKYRYAGISKLFVASNLVALPVKSRLFALIRSPHVYKRSRNQYGQRRYKYFFNVTSLFLIDNFTLIKAIEQTLKRNSVTSAINFKTKQFIGF